MPTKSADKKPLEAGRTYCNLDNVCNVHFYNQQTQTTWQPYAPGGLLFTGILSVSSL